MRERGVQSRRLRPGGVEPEKRPNPGPGGGTNVWQIIAIVALLFATAGWTTVAVITLRPATAAVDTNPTDTEDPTAGEESVPPVADSHDATELEALLPTELTGTPLQAQSWTGDVYLAGDDWGNSVTSFLTANGKTPSDFRAAQVADPAGSLAGTMFAYQVAGVDPTKLRDALLAAWKGDYPDMKTTTTTIGGKDITKGDFGADADSSYLFIKDGVVYDVETSDAGIAEAALGAIGKPAGSRAPVTSAAPGGSVAPAPSGSPAP